MDLASAARKAFSNGSVIYPENVKKKDNHRNVHDNISLVSISTAASTTNLKKPEAIQINNHPSFKAPIVRGHGERPSILVTAKLKEHNLESIDQQSQCSSVEASSGKSTPELPTFVSSSGASKWLRAGRQVRQAVAAAQAFQRPETRQTRIRRHLYGSKASIPVLPVPIAVLLLILNIVLPGLGTAIAGFTFCCCATTYDKPDRKGIWEKVPGLICRNVFTGLAQLFTITFLLVGWIWSIVWGITMVQLAVERKKEIEEGSDWFPGADA